MKLSAEIKINNYLFTQPYSVSIEKSTRALQGTAVVELPISSIKGNKQRKTTEKTIKRGDAIEILLGYDSTKNKEFAGFVKDVETLDNTIKISCEDALYSLRENIKNKIYSKTTLKDLIKDVCVGFTLNSNIPDVNFDSFIIKNATGLQILAKLKEEYGFVTFLVDDNTVYTGLPYLYKAQTVKYDLSLNVPPTNNELTYKEADDIKYKIKAISVLKNNKRLVIETGDDTGEQRTLYFKNISNEAELEKLANSEMLKYKFTGYRGSLLTYGIPFAQIGGTAVLNDPIYPERAGNYYIESVTVSFNTNDGFRRKIELGIKL